MARRSLAADPCGCCGRDSDMTCPRTDPLDELIDALADEGFEVHFNDIDAQMAHSPFWVCTNCGACGRFTYTGMRSEHSYRAFLICFLCQHWAEV